MNAATVYFAFIGILFPTNFVCKALISDTALGKFMQNSVNDIDANQSTDYDKETYRNLNKDAFVSAFKGFLQIVDDPLWIQRSTMNYNIADVIRSKGFVENLSISYLKNATLDHVFISDKDSYVELKITFPLLAIAGWYNMTFDIDRHNMSFYGNGSFSIQLNDLSILSNITLEKTQQGCTVPNKIAWNQTLSGISVKISNLLDDPQISTAFSENLSDIIPVLHNSYKSVIDEFMAQAVMIYGKMLFFNSKHANLETIVAAFAKQTAVPNT